MISINKFSQKPSSYLYTVVSNACCPICKTTQNKLLYTVTCEDAAQHFILREVDFERNKNLADHIATLWGKQTCDVVRCDSCDFAFANPYVSGDSTFYMLAYQRTGYPQWKWEYQKTADAISEITLKPMNSSVKLLEIGAGDGAFVRKISPGVIPQENIFCLEFSDYGRKRINDYGIQCLGEDIRSTEISKLSYKFDVICMFQVLEHMDRLDELFNRLNFLSSEKAHLFISVPNTERIEFNETNGCLLDMPPNHIGRWNLNGFKKISADFGWTVADYQIEPINKIAMIKQLVTYRYLKASQDASTLANKIEQIKSAKTRLPLRILVALFYLLGMLDILLKGISNKNQGDSQWIHLVREA